MSELNSKKAMLTSLRYLLHSLCKLYILLSQLTLPFDEAIERTASVFPINNDPYQLPWYPPKSVLDSLLLLYCLWLDGRVPITI